MVSDLYVIITKIVYTIYKVGDTVTNEALQYVGNITFRIR